MRAPPLLPELERAARRAGIRIRYESIDRSSAVAPAGGLCLLRGERLILVDAKLGHEDRIALLARALARVDLRGVEIADSARAVIALERRRLAAKARERSPGRATAVRAGAAPLKPLARARARPRST